MSLILLKLFALFWILTNLKVTKCSDEETNEKLQKIVLNQHGYLQFVAYRLEVPQITQYTFCIWLKSYNLTHVHPLVSTSQNGHDQSLYVYISPYGRYLITKILSQELLKVSLQIQENQWNNICQSWNSRSGWWQVYINGKLYEQGVNEMLRHVLIPQSKDLIVGQEMANIDVGLSGGIHGEVFGFNMVLTSTTEVPNSNDYQLQPTNIRESIITPDNRDEQRLVEYMNELRRQQQEFDQEGDKFQRQKINTIFDEDEVSPPQIDFDDEELDLEDEEELIDVDYPSELLTPPSHQKTDDSFHTNTDLSYDIHTNHPPSSPGIALYQTPPSLPKYLGENHKASYELKYVKENYKGNVKNEKFANAVLNYLKSNRHKKNRFRKNKPNTKRTFYRTNRRNGPYARASERHEFVVDSPYENVQMKTIGNDRKVIQKRNINVEIINPETVIEDYTRKRIQPNSDNTYFFNGDFDIHEDSRDTEIKQELPKYTQEAKHPYYLLTQQKEKQSHLDVHAQNRDNGQNEEPFESTYSRIYYTGPNPKYKKRERKALKSNDIKYSPKRTLVPDDLIKLRFSPVPRAFAVSRDVSKPLEYDKNRQRDTGVLQKSAASYRPRSYEELHKLQKSAKNGDILNENHNFEQHRNRESIFGDSSKNIVDIEKYKADIKDYLSNPSRGIIQRQGPISSGRKLIELSYRKCLMEQGSPMAYDQTSLVTWNFTPVTLYGGPIIQIANPECGNF